MKRNVLNLNVIVKGKGKRRGQKRRAHIFNCQYILCDILKLSIFSSICGRVQLVMATDLFPNYLRRTPILIRQFTGHCRSGRGSPARIFREKLWSLPAS